ncbi:bifunctional hydroxylase/dehydrase [Streptoalloteichus tenebrarius]|uniref:Bifunctional hydroxylase/dehydrase n=1 Tax=Streptoalloteichus tenebrarius (strain ATCC 17920 / DSM 40477 / JCM 4838 / CBS 697.72 / NBRC 16177 / NCIMB 11028 / NRRL B-12390 / A12253. 1 / ISP 5477) TaxID=1933 RepID=A0ABT1HYN1_STRSD|nr:FAD-dependent monooxygenase [Streptoalloteichus tenebrarius]MCP2260637.1 bifunctional hydroxylase/dehydrase [Streptoalloteichus tenebrarius]BFF01521.1 FAD-dependent monooxygenase [Streptoalloteichus tenebrarius]
MDAQVVVVGAGPVGLMLAAELRLGGAEVVVLERLPRPRTESRAIGITPRTLEVLDQRGVLDRLGDVPRRRLGHFAALPVPLDYGLVDGAHPVMALHPQARTERVLAAWAAELGVPVRWGHGVVGLAQDADGVKVEVEGPEGRYRLRAGYLVGCDGGHSTVRHAAGFDFPGTGGDRHFVMADVTGVDLRPRLFQRNERGAFAVVPLGEGVTRIWAHEHGSGKEPPTYEDLRVMLRHVAGEDLAGATPRWVSTFGDAARQVTEYRRGRVLLAGDAAHVHFPAGGQGLNLGVQDAVNLGWKLAAEVRGGAPDGLLDTYHSERHPVGARVVWNTRAQTELMVGGPELDPVRELLAELLELDVVNRRLARMVAGVDVRYPVGRGTHPLPGARLPRVELSTKDGMTTTSRLLHRARGVLLDLAGGGGRADTGSPAPGSVDGGPRALAAGWADRVDVVEATARGDALAGLRALLLRPDGHVAWVEPDDGEGLDVALRRWFGPSGAEADISIAANHGSVT